MIGSSWKHPYRYWFSNGFSNVPVAGKMVDVLLGLGLLTSTDTGAFSKDIKLSDAGAEVAANL